MSQGNVTCIYWCLSEKLWICFQSLVDENHFEQGPKSGHVILTSSLCSPMSFWLLLNSARFIRWFYELRNCFWLCDVASTLDSKRKELCDQHGVLIDAFGSGSRVDEGWRSWRLLIIAKTLYKSVFYICVFIKPKRPLSYNSCF